MTEKRNKNPFSEIGSSHFEEFVNTKGAIFVDKTLFIEDVVNGQKVLLITRPRRWGKTLNMTMLEYFFSIPVKKDGFIDVEKHQKKIDIFSQMNISTLSETIKEYCGRYPTIFVSFKDIKANNYEDIKNKLARLVQDLYIRHIYLQNSPKLSDAEKYIFQKYLYKVTEQEDLEQSLRFLNDVLYKHFSQKVVILIDEYDTPMNDWYAQQLASNLVEDGSDNLLKQVLSLFSGILGAALKDNDYLEKAVVTGILRIAKASLFSGLNNLGEASILDKQHAKHFGFTEEEVNKLLHDCKMDCNEEAIQNLKLWYNGYNVGGLTIYNPWSIMNYLHSRELKAHWVRTASTTLIENALILDKFQEEVQKLIKGGTIEAIADPEMVFTDIKSSPNALYNLLLFSGYLTTEIVENGRAGTYECTVRVPNKEVSEVFEASMMHWLVNKFDIETTEYNAFINELLEAKINSFMEKLRNYLERSSSFFSTGPKNAEVFYNGFMQGLIVSVSNRYWIETEKESGGGRLDLLLIPKTNTKYRNALIIEYKVTNKEDELENVAQKALEQIKSRNYESKVSNYEKIERTIIL